MRGRPAFTALTALALLIVNVTLGRWACRGYPPRAFNNQLQGLNIARRALGSLLPLSARCTQDSLPETDEGVCSALLESCVLSAAFLRPLLVLSSLDHQSALELLSLPACCCACEQTQLLAIRDAGIVHSALSAAFPRQLTGSLEHLAPSSFAASQTRGIALAVL